MRGHGGQEIDEILRTWKKNEDGHEHDDDE